MTDETVWKPDELAAFAPSPETPGLRAAALRVATEMHARRLACDMTGDCIGPSFHLVDAEPLAIAALAAEPTP